MERGPKIREMKIPAEIRKHHTGLSQERSQKAKAKDLWQEIVERKVNVNSLQKGKGKRLPRTLKKPRKQKRGISHNRKVESP